MIVFAHTEFGLVRIKGSGVERGAKCAPPPPPRPERVFEILAWIGLTISMRGQRATMGKIQRNNYHHGSCDPSLMGKTMSVFLIFMHGTHRNVKTR